MIVCAITGILASIAIPQFLSFQARSKQAEAKANLRGWYTAQTLFSQEKNRYSEAITDTGFSVTVGNRYAYLMGQSCIYEVRNTASITTPLNANCITVDTNRFTSSMLAYPAATIAASFSGAGGDPGTPGVGGTCPACNASAVATSNLDNESAGVDTWFISTKGGTAASCGSNETVLVSGLPFHIKNDITCD